MEIRCRAPSVKYEDIFSQNDKKLIQISKICESACMTRERLINSNANV